MDELPVDTTTYSLSEETPPPQERRDGERHLTLFRVGTMIIDGERELCLIRNISAGGMMVRAYRAVRPGQEVTVELKCGQPLSGRISWVRDQQLGLTFHQPIDVVAILAQNEHGPRPRMPRIETQAVVTVREGASSYRLQASDISQGGIKVTTKGALQPGSDVVVSLTGLEPQPGVVRWCQDGLAGITFNRLLPLPTLIAWLRTQRDGAQAA